MKARTIALSIGWLLAIAVFVDADSYPFENRKYTSDNVLFFEFRDGRFSYINSWFDQFGEPGGELIPVSMSGPYEIKMESGYTVARVRFPEGERRIYVFSLDKHAILYDTELDETLFGTEAARDESYIYPARGAEASSAFREVLGGKEVHYLAGNLSDWDLTTVWVEGAEGRGEGETLTVGPYPAGLRHLVVLNGFFSPRKPSLYLDNGRVKKLELRGYDEQGRPSFSAPFELPDSPSLQVLDFIIPAVRFEIEILEVYPGRKYSDTALTGLFVDGLRVMEEQARLLRPE